MIAKAIQNGLPESAAGFMGMLYAVVRNGWTAASLTTCAKLPAGHRYLLRSLQSRVRGSSSGSKRMQEGDLFNRSYKIKILDLTENAI